MPKTRIKTHQRPGDICKSEKIAMLEGDHSDRKRAKNFKRALVLSRERAVIKERFRKSLQDQGV